MEKREILVELRRPKSRKQIREERRLRILENALNIALGIGGVAAAFWGGWLVGSGAIW